MITRIEAEKLLKSYDEIYNEIQALKIDDVRIMKRSGEPFKDRVMIKAIMRRYYEEKLENIGERIHKEISPDIDLKV